MTHQVVRESLQRVQHQIKFTKKEKLLLLKYVLEDGKYDDLHGIMLLPLANGEYSIFYNAVTSDMCI